MRGFYSPIDQLAAQLPRTKGTGAEFMTELSKRPGYKPQEAQDRDLQTLMALPKMERAQFLQALKAKPAPQLEESTLAESILKNRGLNVLPDEPTKYEKYTLPGGSNYREILLQMPHDPNRKADPSSGHWDQPNVLAHVRAKDRAGPNGEKILHIEEIQSDWHKQGHKKGYLPPDMSAQMQAATLAHRRLKEQLEQAKANSEHAERGLNSNKPLYQDPEVRQRLQAAIVKYNNDIMDLMPQVMKAEAARQDLEQKAKTGVPDAPFKKNWHELALKKMIHHAAEKGYDAIAITPGQEQADRWKLSKHIGMVSYHPEEQRFQAFKPNRETVINEKGATPERVAELIGKDAAERLMKAPKAGDHHYLEGEDLNIGGKGIKNFYDNMVPGFLNQFGKKYGAQVGTIPVAPNITEGEIYDKYFGEVHDAMRSGDLGAQRFIAKKMAEINKPVPMHHFPITPQMREDVTKNGVPLYAEGGEVEVKPTVYDPNLQRKHPELEAAIRGVAAGTTTHKQLDKLIAKHKPIKPYEFVPQPASDEDAERALKPAQKPKWRGHEQWPAGRKVGLRLDIPAYENHGVWVNSVHDEEGKGDDNLKVAYGPVSSVKNAVFDPTPHKAEEVGTGEKGKSSFARIKGDLHHMTENEAVKHMKTYLNHPDYAQVGFDPRRHGFFYDRKTMKPVTHSAHVVQIGPLVLAHKPTYGKRENYAKGGSVPHLAIGGQGPKNWIKGGVESVVKPLKLKVTTDQITQYAPEQVERLQSTGRLARNDAVNQWIDRNLTNYIKKQMATHDDPIRKLAEQGIVHMPPEQMGLNRYKANTHRATHGAERLGESDEAKAWEDATDVAMEPMYIRNLHPDYREPWMEKADPKTQIFTATNDMHAHFLGFDHLVDILKQDLAEGRLRPDQLSKVSIEHAVRRAHEYDQERKKAMAETALKATEGMPVHKEYPEGYKWVELALPEIPQELPEGHKVVKDDRPNLQANPWHVISPYGDIISSDKGLFFKTPEEAIRGATNKIAYQKLADALKYEGDTMGHCVGGYCPDVLEGRSRIYSLRDAKGEPHVTIEVKPDAVQKAIHNLPKNEREALSQEVKNQYFEGQMPGVRDEDQFWDLVDQHYVAKYGSPAPRIKQIKGKQNRAPKKDYIPYVQDFVKSGKWSEVGDARNAGLRKYGDVFNVNEQRQIEKTGEQVPEHEWLTGEDIQRLHNAIVPPGKRLKYDANGNIIGNESGYAKGGSIKPIGYTKEKVTVSPNLDAMRYELMSVKHFAKKVK